MAEAKQVVARTETMPAAPSSVVTPLEMLQRAIERGIDSAQLTQLMDLSQRWEADQARKAYVAAMAAFKSEPMALKKNKTVKHSGTEFRHADLAGVVDAVVRAMSKHGLSHRWDTKQEGDAITVTCVITHALGHSERTTLSAAPDKSGSKNSIQAIGSTVSYLERYTLMAATGLAASDMDDDGKGAEPNPVLSFEQAVEIKELLESTDSDVARFLKWAKVESVEQISARSFETVKARLLAKRK